jgi:multiple antibiotic resistance protein
VPSAVWAACLLGGMRFRCFLATAVTSMSSYWILAGADRVRQHLGKTGIRILTRLLGLMLTAIAVQFVLNPPRRRGHSC